MFGFAKYLAAAHLYRRARGPILTALAAVAAIVLVSAVSDDILAGMGEGRGWVLAAKWLSILGLLALIARSVVRISAAAAAPFAKTPAVPDPKKERILSKPHLRSRSERILERYREEAS